MVAHTDPLDRVPCKKGLNPPSSRFDFRELGHLLLNLAFFVDHVLADNGIVLFDLHFIRRVLLVFICGVVVACASTGNQLNLVSHNTFLLLRGAS